MFSRYEFPFKDAGYPEKMVRNITTKVLNSERDISIKEKVDRTSDQIRVVSTYKADDSIVKAVKSCEDSLKLTQSFRNDRGSLFTFVKKVGPNISGDSSRYRKERVQMDA